MNEFSKGTQNGLGLFVGISAGIVAAAVVAEVIRPKEPGESTDLTRGLRAGWESMKSNYSIYTTERRC